MQIPVVRGVIERRILVNYRVEPGVLARVVPAPFRPKLVNGTGIAGICLIRLKDIRPKLLPASIGIASENAAHRIAVEWDDVDGPKEGVFVARRDTSSRFNALAGGRLFPGLHHHAGFQVHEHGGHYRIELTSDDCQTHLLVEGQVAQELPDNSIFRSLDGASEFFERGALGYSATTAKSQFDGLELRSFAWQVQPLAVEIVTSSFFENEALFPPGSVEFDSALLMRNIEHEWHGRGRLCVAASAAQAG